MISVCGKIFNEGGAIYTGGGIYVSDALGDSFATLIASFTGAVPNDSCRRLSHWRRARYRLGVPRRRIRIRRCVRTDGTGNREEG